MKISQADAERFKTLIGDPVCTVHWKHKAFHHDCWPWLGNIDAKGYGRLGKQLKAHRISYELFVGPAPDRLLVCHTCDRKDCVNPQHLFLGTQQDNVDDMRTKGRAEQFINYKGEKCPAVHITEAQALEVIRLHNAGLSSSEIVTTIDSPMITYGIVRHIVRGRTWKHLPRD